MNRLRKLHALQLLILLLISGVISSREAMADGAGACPTVRLDQNGGPFAKIPPYDQSKFSQREDLSFAPDGISGSAQNLCYSVADSELLDAERFANGDPLTQLTSPISIALNHKTRMSNNPPLPFENVGDGMDNPNVVGPGNPMMALVSNNGQQVCDQNWLENYASMLVKTNGNEAPDSPTGRSVRSFFKGVFEQIDKVGQLDASLAKKEDLMNDYFKCGIANHGANMNDILAASRAALKAADPIPRAQIFLSQLCKDHSFTVHSPTPRFYNGLDEKPAREKAIAEIANKMFANHGAEADKYNPLLQDARAKANDNYGQYSQKLKAKIAGLLTGAKPKPVGIALPLELISTENFSASADHAAVIIGQQWNGQTCDYLIRDSVAGCRKRSKYPCDNGSIWVPQDDLATSGGPTNEGGVGIFWIP